jgi:hypothetical protein
MKIFGFCAFSLLCVSCVETKPVSSGISPEDVAQRVVSADHYRLQAWCAEDGRTGSDVALRVVDCETRFRVGQVGIGLLCLFL